MKTLKSKRRANTRVMRREYRIVSLAPRSAVFTAHVIKRGAKGVAVGIPALIADKFPVGAKVKVTIELVGEG